MSAQPAIQIIDYGLGNLFSIQQACRKSGLEPVVSANVATLRKVDGIILPGVGAFGNAMERLRELEIIEPLVDVVREGKPLMGICLGMQLLFEQSEEFGTHQGLRILPGRIRRIPSQFKAKRRLRVPNVGWNRVYRCSASEENPILRGIPDAAFMYFVHSYYVDAVEPSDQMLRTKYGEIDYCCATQRDNVLGVQFHPEKSGTQGLKFYKNWAALL